MRTRRSCTWSCRCSVRTASRDHGARQLIGLQRLLQAEEEQLTGGMASFSSPRWRDGAAGPSVALGW